MIIFISLACLIAGGAAGLYVKQIMATKKFQQAQKQAESIIEEAKTKNKEILLEAKEQAIKLRNSAEVEYRDRRSDINRLERRLTQKDENLDRKMEAVERREHNLVAKEKEAQGIRANLDELKKKELQQLEVISGMTSTEAKQQLMSRLEIEVREEASRKVKEWESQITEEADEKARKIVSAAIQRCATDVTSEVAISTVPLPSDEMKGRLIGREGRNIRALEHATGVDLIIDDTPEAVTLACFDPVRREIARVALTKLILNGRIHPARIEEVVEKAKSEVDETIKSEGEKTALKAGVPGLHPELIKLLGRLKFRTSYGQNVLQHSLEVSYLAAMMANEIGFNHDLAKRAGLLHDIGKAVDHQVEGPHASIGADLVKQWEKSEQVVAGIAEHHGETSDFSTIGFIVSAADAISGGRPGARGESLEHYLKRLENLEAIANSFEGVEKSYAIQAGREIRILVKPDSIDDLGSLRMARDIVKKIQDNLEYPGQIKVTVIRETRAVEYAK
ncbi:MAG: ribonuclease Y [Dehalococcoidia bacterium]|nr:ribonuclease Y [Dehalococcoidia bacterium]MDZ4246824.1 ribonuclease Y [Dehalococcoidia bacterium]